MVGIPSLATVTGVPGLPARSVYVISNSMTPSPASSEGYTSIQDLSTPTAPS